MKESITLSINPSYLCNLRCDFCYLSNDQLSNSSVIKNDLLIERLAEVSAYRNIEHIDLYGGEIGVLDPLVLDELISTIRFFYAGSINVITNLTVVPDLFLRPGLEISVSWDFFGRQHHKKVYENMLSFPRDFHVLILASEKLVNMSDVELGDFIDHLNKVPNLQTVEIKPYSSNQFRSQHVPYIQFENWLKKWIAQSHKFKFEFINIKKIKNSLAKKYSSWSDDHLYLTPEGKFAVLEFDINNKEFFLELDGFNDFVDWTTKEKTRVLSNEFCANCEYLGNCLSEHLKPIYDYSQSCNGFRNLLTWYQKDHERV